tara:strand:- start:76 stop:321 length:246 start_codon:yes stop_codon:yes gene_type:complete
VFQLLIKNGLIDDLFKINSSYLQAFIENELWMYDNERATDIRIGQQDTENVTMEAENTEEFKAKKFGAILRATQKHFMSIN